METFKQYLAEWVVACNQPFEEVKRPEFRCLMGYMYMGSKLLKIPHRIALKDRIMKMGKSAIEGIQIMVEVRTSPTLITLSGPDSRIWGLKSNVSLSLDAWTSSNGHVFLAIVMHWINDDWKLGTSSHYN
jgi:hypothetical protein